MFTSLVQVYNFKMSTNRLGRRKMSRSEVRGGEERSVRVGGGGKRGARGGGGRKEVMTEEIASLPPASTTGNTGDEHGKYRVH